MKPLFSFTRSQLREEISSLGVEPYRADQILGWVYKKGILDFGSMTNLPKDLREILKNLYVTKSLTLLKKVQGPDATKYLFRTKDGHLVETVLIKERDHYTLCVSTQVGCAVGCTFCATAIDGLKRNLSADEIVDQYMQVFTDSGIKPRNVVFMGMGEPLANYENLRKACEIFVSPWGLDLSKRRVTVSTSGIISQIRRMAKDPLMRDLNLAVSINAPYQDLRERIMPLTKTNPLDELMEELKRFPLPRYRRITLEYVLIKDLNDSPQHARDLAKLIGRHKKRFKVNLIPYNPDPLLPYSRPPLERIFAFQRELWERGISTFVRFSKGVDVFGACGQLRAREELCQSG